MGKKGKSILLCLTVLMVAALCCFAFVACNVDDIKEISVTATYNSGKVEEAVLTEEMIAPKDRLKFFLEGEYNIEVTYREKTTSLAVNVRRNVFAGATFNDLDVVYNGDFYVLEVKNVPEGTVVSYPSTNRFRSAGEYQATAILRKDAYEMKQMTAKITIRKADYDLSQVKFEDKDVTYNGASHELALEGDLPAGLYVDYTITKEGGREEKGNTATNSGAYRVEAKFSGDYVNYNVVENKQALLTIKQAEIDMSGLKFEDKTVVYDRTKQSIELQGDLPRGVNVTYIDNEHVDAGRYEAIATFTVDDTVNYAPIEDMKAILFITKAEYDMSDVHFNGIKVTYDGKEKKIEIQGQLPTGVTVSYDNNTGTDAGSYEVTASFSSNSENYNDPAPMTATLIIDPALAPMDQIVFERRRFISQKSMKDDSPDWYWDKLFNLDDEYEELIDEYKRIYYYDPYLAAKEYVPQNVPTGLSISSVKYKETAGWVDDLTEYDGVGDSYFEADKLDHDGYYVVIVNFDGGINYTGVTSVKTLIRVNTIERFSIWEQLIYDDTWKNTETGEETGAFMDYYMGACVPWNERERVTIGDITIEYCDCNIFFNYKTDGEEALFNSGDAYVSKSKLEDYKFLAEQYSRFMREMDIDFDSSASENSREWTYTHNVDTWLDKAYSEQVNRPDEMVMRTTYDSGNPFGMISQKFGEIENLTPQTGNGEMPQKIIDYIDSVSQKFAEFMGTFGIPKDGTKYVAKLNEENIVKYNAFYDEATTLLDCALFPFSENAYGYWASGAIIGANYPFSIILDEYENEETGEKISDLDLQQAAAYFFGFSSKTDFMNYAQQLVTLYNQYRTDKANSVAVNTALENGCFLAQNGSFIFPFINKSNFAPMVYAFLIIDVNGYVSLWVNDANSFLWALSFRQNDQINVDIENDLYSKNMIFLPSNFVSLLNAAELASRLANNEDTSNEENICYEFDLHKAAYVPLNDSFDYFAITNSTNGRSISDYYELLAFLFGFEDVDEFFGMNSITGMVFDTYMTEEFRNKAQVSMESTTAQLACAGAIYEEVGSDYMFIFPYNLIWLNNEGNLELEFLYLFCAEIAGGRSYGVLFSDVDMFFSLYYDAPEQDVVLQGRCTTAEVALTRLLPKTRTVEKDGDMEEVVITNGKDFALVENSEATNFLVNEDREVYGFVSELPGSCTELSEEYDADWYKISSETSVYSFCDCDPFATVIKSNGDASGITRRDEREDHAQMTAEVARQFDILSGLFKSFISNYVTEVDVVNEWKIGASNRNYNAYKVFFEFARDMFLRASRNMGKGSEYFVSSSVIIGMNRGFSITMSSSGLDYTVDQYRLMVAKLFGFFDIDSFNAYTNALAEELVANKKKASVDSESKRLLYDGAVLTENGYYVLPYAIKSETSASKVLVFVFVDDKGSMSIWINNAKNAFNATNFGSTVFEDDDDKYTVDIYGRCLLFEDDGFLMKEDLSKYVVDVVNSLQGFARSVFAPEEHQEDCKDSNYASDDDTYLINNNDSVFRFCDCDPLSNLIKMNGNTAGLRSRQAREDIPMLPETYLDDFDELSALYQAFFSKYVINENEENDWKLNMNTTDFLKYRKFFRYARDLFKTAKHGFDKTEDYLVSDSVLVGMNKSFSVSVSGKEYTTEEYRLMAAKLFGFTDLETFARYAEALANMLKENGRNANTDSLFERLIYDGAILTQNGYFVMPYRIKNMTSNKQVYALIFVGSDGTAAIWISNVAEAFGILDFTEILSETMGRDIITINGMCVLFEDGNYYGFGDSQFSDYIAVEKIRSFASAGDFLVYSPFSDEEGFEVYWFSIYRYELEAIYDDEDNQNVGTVQKGCYTLINVASIEEVRAYNKKKIDEYIRYEEDEEDNG